MSSGVSDSSSKHLTVSYSVYERARRTRVEDLYKDPTKWAEQLFLRKFGNEVHDPCRVA
jgi:hypothetical protein